VFCVVQDRVTAAGARRYVDRQRATIAAGAPPIAIEDVMAPARRQSVEQGLLWGGGVLAAGLVAASVWRGRS
jgi:hypothetical protein